jgi:pimeloyl-ACP methyl ester carboxylesterase
MPSGVAWVAALLAMLALFVAGPVPAAAPATSECDNVTQPGIIAGTTPILFVHGIDSDPTTWTTGTVSGTSVAPLNYVDGALGTQVTGYTFDWSKYSGFRAGSTLSWVTGAPGPGQLLAEAIKCVAGKAGHKVIIVAHSMGGLLAEYASSSDSSVSGDIAAVFTLGTPFAGSWLDSTATSSLGWLSQAIGAYCSFGGSLYSPGTAGQVAKQHVKPSGGLEALCRVAGEREDPGMQGMRTGLAKGQGWHALSWPGVFPVFPLAASIQATSWQPLPLFGPQVTFADFGDFVVGTSSELAGGGTPTVTCTVPLDGTGAPVLLTLLDAVSASSCFHANEPDNKTLLDSIISTIKQRSLIPDWYNTEYTMNCGGAAMPPITIRLKNGKAVAAGPGGASYSSYQIHVEAVTKPGDLTVPGNAETAVLLYCSPQPSNYYNEEVQIFQADGSLLAELPRSITLPGTPLYDSSKFYINDGQLVTGMKFYGPGDSHASGPSISKIVTWHWDGRQFVHSPISLPQAPACPKAAPGIPAGLVSAVAAQVGNQCGLEIEDLKTDSNDPSWVTFAISPTPGSLTQGGGGIAHQVNGSWPVVLTGSAFYWCDPRVPTQVVADFGLPCP